MRICICSSRLGCLQLVLISFYVFNKYFSSIIPHQVTHNLPLKYMNDCPPARSLITSPVKWNSAPVPDVKDQDQLSENERRHIVFIYSHQKLIIILHARQHWHRLFSTLKKKPCRIQMYATEIWIEHRGIGNFLPLPLVVDVVYYICLIHRNLKYSDMFFCICSHRSHLSGIGFFCHSKIDDMLFFLQRP
jgi:hypothetical protein